MPPETRFTIDNPGQIRSLIKTGMDCFVFFKVGNRFKVNKTIIASNEKIEFTIPLPFDEEPDIPKEPGTIFLFKVHLENGALEFSASVTGQTHVGRNPYLVMQNPHSVLRTQRRQAYRVHMTLPARLTLQKDGPHAIVEENILILDLSLAGALVAVNTEISPGPKGILEFRLPLVVEPIQIEFQVQRQKPVQALKTRHKHQYGLKFDPLPSSMESLLARYINEKQVNVRNRKQT